MFSDYCSHFQGPPFCNHSIISYSKGILAHRRTIPGVLYSKATWSLLSVTYRLLPLGLWVVKTACNRLAIDCWPGQCSEIYDRLYIVLHSIKNGGAEWIAHLVRFVNLPKFSNTIWTAYPVKWSHGKNTQTVYAVYTNKYIYLLYSVKL